MSKTITVSSRVVYQGVEYPTSRTVTADAETSVSPSGGVTPAVAGTLSLRTDNDTGELTLSGGHGVTTGARLDVYWATGSRIGMVVGTVAGNVVPVDQGVGDDLPTLSTAIRAKVPQEEAMVVTGSNVQAALVTFTPASPSDYPATIVFATAANAVIRTYALTAALPAVEWDVDMPDTTSPFTGDAIAKVFLSHGNIDASRAMSASLLYD